MRSFYLSVLSMTAATILPAIAEDAALRIPSLGFHHDNARALLQEVQGIPGAAVMGKGSAVGFTAATSAFSAEFGYLIGVSAGDGALLFSYQGMAVRTIPGAILQIDRINLSPSSRAAVLYSASLARVQVLTGLPAAPVVEREFSTAGLGEPVAHPAVSDDGKVVLFPGSSLWLLDADTGRAQIDAAAALVNFRDSSHEAAAALRTGELILIDSTGAVARRVPPGSAGDPVGLQLSAGAAYLAFADGTLAAVNTSTGERKELSCQCAPAGLHRAITSIFRVTGGSGSPLILLDVSGSEPRLWFVPADRADEISGGAQ